MFLTESTSTRLPFLFCACVYLFCRLQHSPNSCFLDNFFLFDVVKVFFSFRLLSVALAPLRSMQGQTTHPEAVNLNNLNRQNPKSTSRNPGGSLF